MVSGLVTPPPTMACDGVAKPSVAASKMMQQRKSGIVI
jgi:hypothetical protein